MRLKIFGAAQEVTGSSYLLEVNGHRVLVDFGTHQGENEEANYDPIPFDPTSIDALLLTHAHIDHSGRIPLLIRNGFKGKVYCTVPTSELVEILWYDSAKIMGEDAQWRSRKNQRKGLPPVEPLYDEEDVSTALKHIYPVSYDDRMDVVPGLSVRFRDAGHIIGSSIIEAFLTEGEKHVKVTFSGDLGPAKTVMERNPAEISESDYVLIESTYGDRDHKTNEETRAEFQELMTDIMNRRSKIYIPTFVVDRAQRIMYELALLRDQGIGEDLPVFFDSPMGVKATEVYQKHLDLMSQEIQMYRRSGKNPFSEGISFVSSVDESRAINNEKYAVVMAGSGMVNAGRMVHHLKNGIWNPDNHVVFVGYQAVGTLGRRIVDGAKSVRIAGEEVAVKAKIHTIGGFSAHADRTDLLTWAEHFRPSMPQFIVVHGEPHSSTALCEALTERGFEAAVPEIGQEFELEPRTHGAIVGQAHQAASQAGELVRDLSDQEGSAATTPDPDLPIKDRTPDDTRALREKKGQPARLKGRSREWRHLYNSLERLGDQVQNLYSLTEHGRADGVQPLIDAASLLLETARGRMGGLSQDNDGHVSKKNKKHQGKD